VTDVPAGDDKPDDKVRRGLDVSGQVPGVKPEIDVVSHFEELDIQGEIAEIEYVFRH
jgi:hypothetical protein